MKLLADFPVPSSRLTVRLTNLSSAEWWRELGRSPLVDAAIAQATAEFREVVWATLAHFAQVTGHSRQRAVRISSQGVFSDEMGRELLVALPIDPQVGAQVLNQLHAELLAVVKKRGIQAPWGELVEHGGDLVLQVRLAARAQATVF